MTDILLSPLSPSQTPAPMSQAAASKNMTKPAIDFATVLNDLTASERLTQKIGSAQRDVDTMARSIDEMLGDADSVLAAYQDALETARNPLAALMEELNTLKAKAQNAIALRDDVLKDPELADEINLDALNGSIAALQERIGALEALIEEMQEQLKQGKAVLVAGA